MIPGIVAAGRYLAAGGPPALNPNIGKVWTTRTAEQNQWNDVAWSPSLGIFAAVASNGTNRLMTSPDGHVWTPVFVYQTSWLRIIWVAQFSRFVAFSGSTLSQNCLIGDASGWSTRVTGHTGTYESITCNPSTGRILALRRQNVTSSIVYSDDGGETWNIDTSLPFSSSWYDVKWCEGWGCYIAINGEVNSNAIWKSTTGAGDWVSTGLLPARNLSSFSYSKELGKAVLFATSGPEVMVMESPSTIRRSTADMPGGDGAANSVWAPERGLFVATRYNRGAASEKILTSMDGEAFTVEATPDNHRPRGICWSPQLSRFVAVCSGSSSYTRQVLSSL